MNCSDRIFLTGGTGFFGRSILKYLARMRKDALAVPEVHVLSRSPKVFLEKYPIFSKEEWLTIHAGDTRIRATFPAGISFTHVIHAATESTNGPMLSPICRYDEIVDGTRNVLNYALDVGASRFLLTSSGGVYGELPKNIERVSETWTGAPDGLNPLNAYSVAKRAAEHLCVLYSHSKSIEVVIARCFAFIGEDLPLNSHFAIGNFIRDALHREEIVVRGNGQAIRSYMYQWDLAHWLYEMLYRGKSGSAYNIGSDNPVSIRSLAECVRELIAPNKKIIYLNQNPDSARSLYVPNIFKATDELDLRLSYTLEESIKETVRSHEDKTCDL